MGAPEQLVANQMEQDGSYVLIKAGVANVPFVALNQHMLNYFCGRLYDISVETTVWKEAKNTGLFIYSFCNLENAHNVVSFHVVFSQL